MKIKIDKNGTLLIERKGFNKSVGEFKAAQCPFSAAQIVVATAGSNTWNCGDWCPLFGEIYEDDDLYYLNLCHKHLYFHEKDFVDERSVL